MERKIISSEALDEALRELSGWRGEADHLKKRWTFLDFASSLAFVNRVGELAEAADHHPDITFGWGYVEIVLTTHDRGGITDVDIALAIHIDKLQ